jgi:hypothetical protein
MRRRLVPSSARMRPSPSFALVSSFLAVLALGVNGTAHADRARALGAPYAPGDRALPRRGEPTRDAASPDTTPPGTVSPDAIDRADDALGGSGAVPEI